MLKRKYLFVVNPVSGGKQKMDWERSIINFFNEHPGEIQIYLLNGADDKTSLQHHLDLYQPEMVVAVGGDGTIKLVAELISGTDFTMGILPAGSANGMARELEIPADAEEALKILVNGKTRRIDLVRINHNEISVHLSDMGMNAMVVRNFERYKGRGWMGYLRSLWRVLWRKRKFSCTISTDRGTIRRNAYMVVVANATKYGIGAVINPEGDLSDGKFEVVIVRKLNVFAMINGLFRGKSFHPKKVEILSTTKLRIETRRKRHFQVDGEYLGRVREVYAEVEAGALQVRVPA